MPLANQPMAGVLGRRRAGFKYRSEPHGAAVRLDMAGEGVPDWLAAMAGRLGRFLHSALQGSELAPRHSISAPFQSIDFRLLWLGALTANLGSLIQGVGAGWLMATITNSNDLVAFVQAATNLPGVIFCLVAGALADSFDRRLVMLVAQYMMIVVSVVSAIFAYTGLLTPWLLLLFTFLIGSGMALRTPAWQAAVGDLVPRAHIPQAVALNSIAMNATRSVGPAIGGLLVATAGAASAFAVNAICCVPLVFALLRWKHRRAPSHLPREALGLAMSAGVRYTAMSPSLLRVISRSFVFGLGSASVLALMPLVARDLVAGGAFTFGILLGAFGVGAVLGAFISPYVRERCSNETTAAISFVVFALSAGLLGFSHQTWLSCLILIPAGMCWVLAFTLFNVVVQLSTPRWVVGRAMSIYQTANFGGLALGSWVWGLFAEAYGPRFALIGSGVSLLAGALIGLRFTMPGFFTHNLDPLNEFKEPELRLDLKARSGPIMIMVDYEIAQEDVPDFLAVMTERRRIRIRDGARHWSLLRDLENTDIWTETYHVPTWVEYVRHNLRRTHADAENAEKLRALHRGVGRPRVHRMIERQTVPIRDDMPIKEHPELP